MKIGNKNYLKVKTIVSVERLDEIINHKTSYIIVSIRRKQQQHQKLRVKFVAKFRLQEN